MTAAERQAARERQCKQKIYDGTRADWGGHQCSRKAVDGMDGYCKMHFPANFKARSEEKQEQWKREAKERADERKRKDDARAEELHKIAAFDDLLVALKFALDNLSHKFKCAAVMPSEQWTDKGSISFDGCTCAIATVSAAIAKAEGRA